MHMFKMVYAAVVSLRLDRILCKFYELEPVSSVQNAVCAYCYDLEDSSDSARPHVCIRTVRNQARFSLVFLC